MSITFKAQFFLAEYGYYGPPLLWRVDVFEAGTGRFYKIFEKHRGYEFSMMVVRKSVTSSPAVRTIFGTNEALVIPGIVLISRK